MAMCVASPPTLGSPIGPYWPLLMAPPLIQLASRPHALTAQPSFDWEGERLGTTVHCAAGLGCSVRQVIQCIFNLRYFPVGGLTDWEQRGVCS
jgi:hypothetical protein